MRIKLRLTLPGTGKPSGHLVEFELAGKTWAANTEKLAGSADEVTGGHGSRSLTRRLVDIDPALVDDFRKTL